MDSETIRQCFMKFRRDVMSMYVDKFLRRLRNGGELQEVENICADKGLPGCVGVLNCMKLHWKKNFPAALKGQYHSPKEG